MHISQDKFQSKFIVSPSVSGVSPNYHQAYQKFYLATAMLIIFPTVNGDYNVLFSKLVLLVTNKIQTIVKNGVLEIFQ